MKKTVIYVLLCFLLMGCTKEKPNQIIEPTSWQDKLYEGNSYFENGEYEEALIEYLQYMEASLTF